MKFLLTPLFQQAAHDHGAFDATGVAIAVDHGGLLGGDLKADFGVFFCHGLGPCLNRKPTHRAQAANAAAHGWCGINSGEETDAGKTRAPGLTAVGGAKHLSGLRYGLRSWMRLVGLGCGQFWPDFLPIVGAQVAAGYCAVCGLLNGIASINRHGPHAAGPLPHQLHLRANLYGELGLCAVLVEVVIEFHAYSISASLIEMQAPRSFFFLSASLLIKP